MSTSGLGNLSSTGNLLQITGLASGLNTNSIIQALLSVDQQPIAHLQTTQANLHTLDSALTAIQSSFRGVGLSAQSLSDPGLFAPTQAITSSNPALVTATAAQGAGAVIGGYTVAVGNLASAAQRTFAFTSPPAGDTVTIDGKPLTLAAGAKASDLIKAVNSSSTLDVWAATNAAGQIVLSARQPGNLGASFIQVTSTSLLEQPILAQNGQDANFTVNGVAGSSHTDTVTGAIPGVTLTLAGVTPAGAPVTVNVQPPAPNAASITAAVQSFVQSYNKAIDGLNQQLMTKPGSGAAGSGQLFGDPDLQSFLSNLRATVYRPGAGLPPGLAALSDIGITTGSASGSASFSQSSVSGDLTVDTTALGQAIAANPNGVQQVLAAWASSFSSIVTAEAGPGGSLDARLQGDSATTKSLADQIATRQEMLTIKQRTLQAQYAKLESTLSNLQSQGSWLSSQISSLPSYGPTLG